ncbi:Enoyl-CoA hydratase [Candidatus Desulfarcum epimagneticum]|uniref:Enoyl-CoA hydratase domain-containing protein 3, mitochondrial n=1 Tax=uncultured Desulfobacteraceae bacterium TaxID=218296 RepID=A0A484HDR6_9BACT|nr:Enoyl-CoA hydratase [uncultured Desulfobacteraceae bacterium]
MTQNENPADSPVLRKDENGVCHLTLNRPKAYNALSMGCMEALIAQFEALSKDPDIRVVIISGSGKGFCAGHDLKEMMGEGTEAFFEKTFATCSKMMTLIHTLPQPVIAKIHGIATAGGCQLVAVCDLAVAEEGARFATPGVNIGLFCSTPMVPLSRTVARKHALELLLMGDMISAQRACEMGLINRVTPQDELDAAVLEMAEKLASKSPLTLKIGKGAFYRQIDMTLHDAYDMCVKTIVGNMMTHDAQEGISAFMEKRKPTWTGT